MTLRLATLLGAWEATLRVRSPHTARSYGQAVRRFLEQLDGDDLSPDAIGGYLDSLEGLAPASRAHHVSAVRSFLRFAQTQGAVEEGPREMLVRPRVAVTSYGRYLDADELRRLIAAARELGPRHYAAVVLLAGTGLRVAEAVAATWRDLYRDPAGRLGLRVVGKGSKERVVRIRDDVFRALVGLRFSEFPEPVERAPDALDARDTTPLLLDSRRTAYSTRGIRKLVAAAAERAGIAKPVSPHWLRHSHATLAAEHGAAAFTIQASLGHSRLETSARYVHMARGLAETTVDALPDFEEKPCKGGGSTGERDDGSTDKR